MKKPRTSEKLAHAWKRGRLSIHTALKRHLQNIEVWPVDPAFLMFLPIILGYANMGLMDRPVPLGTDENGEDVERTVAQIVDDLQLQPFLAKAR